MLLTLILGISSIFYTPAFAQNVDVSFLTQTGPLQLKNWAPADLKKMSKRTGEISSQNLIFDESTKNLDLNDRADVDLVTLYGEDRTTRVPRFMIWRGSLKFYYNKDGSLSSKADTNRLLVPTSIFSVTKIKRIELTRASVLYPETELHLRTNPAASRGEKLFTQSCLACHGLPSAPKLKVETLTDAQLNDFVAKHKSQGAMMLDARATRGLIAYRDALVLEHSGVKPKP